MDRRLLMNFDNWAMNEASNVQAKGLLADIEGILGDKYGSLYIVPDFDTFDRPGEPQQDSILIGSSSGVSFALNYDGSKLFSIDFWEKDSTEPDHTIYADGHSLESILKAIAQSGNANEALSTKESPLVLYVDDEDATETKTRLTVVSAPKEKEEISRQAVKPVRTLKGGETNVIPSVSKNPAKQDPELKSEYDYQDPDTIFEDLKVYTNMVMDGTQPSMLVTGMPGVGKCHRRGDKMLMFDMSVKNVEDIKEDDLLMGDDSKPRRVMALGNGYDDMYEIKPTKGDSMFVNKDHILCVVNTYSGDIIEVSVIDFLNWPKYKQQKHKLYRVPLTFEKKSVYIDPYWLGTWLGDGCSHTAGITISNWDTAILEHHEEYANEFGLSISKSKIDTRGNDNCRVYTPVRDSAIHGKCNPLMDALRSYDLSGYAAGDVGRKFIPIDYITNDRNTRLNLLAGIIDSDGSKLRNGCYEITQKNEQLSKDIAQLARSLGYYVSYKIKKCSIKSIGYIGSYYRITISGAHDVPCKLDRKKSTERKLIKNVLRTGFKILHVGKDDYFGFTLNGNGRYLMQDFVVTHNTYKITQEFKKAGMQKDVDFFHAKGKATAAGMYQTLWDQNGKLILFDDMDSIFKDDNAVNVLKGALDSGDEREVAWISARPLKTPEGEVIPQKFGFTGRIIFITNLAQKDLPDALKSRSFVIEVALSPEDMVSYIEGMFDKIMPYERVSTKRFALDAIKEAASNNPAVQINMRTFIKATKIVRHVSDKAVALRMIIQQCSYK